MSDGLLGGGKRTLVVLFVPSVERDLRQGEIGLVIADHYYAIRDFKEPRR